MYIFLLFSKRIQQYCTLNNNMNHEVLIDFNDIIKSNDSNVSNNFILEELLVQRRLLHDYKSL